MSNYVKRTEAALELDPREALDYIETLKPLEAGLVMMEISARLWDKTGSDKAWFEEFHLWARRRTQDRQEIWHDAAPPKVSRRKAEADLDYCVPDEAAQQNYRIIQRGTRWIIQHRTFV